MTALRRLQMRSDTEVKAAFPPHFRKHTNVCLWNTEKCTPAGKNNRRLRNAEIFVLVVQNASIPTQVVCVFYFCPATSGHQLANCSSISSLRMKNGCFLSSVSIFCISASLISKSKIEMLSRICAFVFEPGITT